MIDPLLQSINNSSFALKSQSLRLRIISENIANAQSTSAVPGGDPYRRKTLLVENNSLNNDNVSNFTSLIRYDRSPFKTVHDPGNIAADQDGNVKMPNVDDIIEMSDLRDANKLYMANVQVIKSAKDMFTQTLDLLKG
jgi:flagellar basal-body rod protein FlgC